MSTLHILRSEPDEQVLELIQGFGPEEIKTVTMYDDVTNYDDLVEECRIDAKHSFEEVILPVEDFKAQYGDRITPLGGLDVDVICRSSADYLRAYTRKKIEKCFGDGHWALGTGNSLTDYMPVENYITVLEEGIRVTS